MNWPLLLGGWLWGTLLAEWLGWPWPVAGLWGLLLPAGLAFWACRARQRRLRGSWRRR